MTSWKEHIPLGAWPRLLPQNMAAAYCACSVPTFKAAVRAGDYPEARPDGKWDRAALDEAINGIPANDDRMQLIERLNNG